MRPLNKHKDKIPEGAVSIMRPGKWGNPYVIGIDGTRAQVIEMYRQWLWRKINTSEVKFLIELAELNRKQVVCCCYPLPCHGDVLLRASVWAENQLQP